MPPSLSAAPSNTHRDSVSSRGLPDHSRPAIIVPSFPVHVVVSSLWWLRMPKQKHQTEPDHGVGRFNHDGPTAIPQSGPDGCQSAKQFHGMVWTCIVSRRRCFETCSEDDERSLLSGVVSYKKNRLSQAVQWLCNGR